VILNRLIFFKKMVAVGCIVVEMLGIGGAGNSVWLNSGGVINNVYGLAFYEFWESACVSRVLFVARTRVIRNY
jgi:hypothetical protein